MIVDTDEPIYGRSVSFFWYKRIYVGTKFRDLPYRVKAAVIAHELGHCDGHHTEWRILALLFPFVIPWLTRWQEYRADAYACKLGYGPELAWLLRENTGGGLFHPTNYLRRQKLVHNKFFAQPPLRATHRYSA